MKTSFVKCSSIWFPIADLKQTPNKYHTIWMIINCSRTVKSPPSSLACRQLSWGHLEAAAGTLCRGLIPDWHHDTRAESSQTKAPSSICQRLAETIVRPDKIKAQRGLQRGTLIIANSAWCWWCHGLPRLLFNGANSSREGVGLRGIETQLLHFNELLEAQIYGQQRQISRQTNLWYKWDKIEQLVSFLWITLCWRSRADAIILTNYCV